MFRNVFSGCVSDRSSQAEVFQCQKLKFGASLSSALKHGFLPGPLVDILVFIAKDGVATADVFRRPGNPNDTRRIVKRLTEGKQVIYSNYSFYTLASVVKKFLLRIPGGVFTPEGEEQLLQVLTVQQKVEQLEIVHHFMESLAPAHQRLIALLFGTWFRIVGYSERNCMSVEALSRSVAGSMFHTCAEDPAKVEKASRIMQFLIENYGVEDMFGRENIQYFVETTRTGLHIRDLYRYSRMADSDLIPRFPAAVRSDFIEVTRMEQSEGDEHHDDEGDDDDDDDRHRDFLGRERQFSSQSPELSPSIQHSDFSHDPSDPHDSQLMINVSTLSAPEVSLMPSPEVSQRPKSLEDNLNEVRSHYQSRCLSRFNSVKRKQLERLRQRSDWFLSPTTLQSRNNSRKGREERLSFNTSGSSNYNSNNNNSGGERGGGQCRGGPNNINPEQNYNSKNHHHHLHHRNGSSNPTSNLSTQLNTSSLHHHHQSSGNNNNTTTTFTKASSEGAVLEAFSDGDSVFTDNTSRSESPASEPVWSHILKTYSRDIIHSDTLGHLTLPEFSLDQGSSSGFDLSLGSQDDLGYCVEQPDHHDPHDHHHQDRQQPQQQQQTLDVLGDSRGSSRNSSARLGDCSNKDEDEDNPTPTGTQEEEEEEDVTVLASSLPDIHHRSCATSGEDSGDSTKGEETDKDSPSTLCGGSGGSGEEEVMGVAALKPCSSPETTTNTTASVLPLSKLTLSTTTTTTSSSTSLENLVGAAGEEEEEEEKIKTCTEIIPDKRVKVVATERQCESGGGGVDESSSFVPIPMTEDGDIDDDDKHHHHHHQSPDS